MSGPPSGSDSLAVRQRYLRHRRRLSDRGWITVWVTLGALVGWLFIAGFAGLGH
ncbi:MAG: hypothetical protein JOZ46_11980 [Candidatus Dormibacteraeota bacterium]|nr:hypothetical protein [Candidatus Dormibacteraeota bacterium]MBV9526519.1 hypothetical protein [Candidatus Dormibacteraeota bacterium]